MRRIFHAPGICLFVLASIFLGQCKNSDAPVGIGMTGNPVIDGLTEAIAKEPKNAELLLQRAQVFYDNEAYDQAIQDLAGVLKIDSTHLTAHRMLADVYLDAYQSARALQTLERAVALYPEDIELKLKLSEFQLIVKQYDAALATLADIMEMHPGNPDALFMLGLVYNDQGKTQQAIGAFQSAVERNPDLTEAWIILGDLMDRTQNPLALQYFDNAIRVDPANISAWHSKAYYLQNHDRMDEALEIYRVIHTIDAQYPEAYLNAAILLIYMDSLDSAMKELDILRKVDPVNAAAWFYIGRVHQVRGEKDKAIDAYEQALRLDSKYEQALDALAEVKEEL